MLPSKRPRRQSSSHPRPRGRWLNWSASACFGPRPTWADARPGWVTSMHPCRAYNSVPSRVIMSRMSAPKSASPRPEATEYTSFYEKYVALVPGNDIVSILDAQRLQMTQLFAARSERDGNFRYAADKWTVKEVGGHITDTERC